MTTFHGPRGTSLFRLLSVRSQLKLEKIGLKSSGDALRPRLAKEFGLSTRASHDDFIKAVEAKIDEAKNALEPGDVRP